MLVYHINLMPSVVTAEQETACACRIWNVLTIWMHASVKWDFQFILIISRIRLYNNPSYSRILIGSRLWSIRRQMNDWRRHYKDFPSAVLKWQKVLRIRKIFYVTGQKIRYKKVFPRHWTGSRSQKTKDKALSFRKWYRNNFLAASVGSRQILCNYTT